MIETRYRTSQFAGDARSAVDERRRPDEARKPMRLSLRPQERLFVNGAVLRVDRKVGVELLNDVTFLMENHVIQPHETQTPLRQLYFVVQTMLIDPINAAQSRVLFDSLYPPTVRSFSNRDIIDGLLTLEQLIEEGRSFEGLKLLRSLFALEEQIIGLAQMREAGTSRPAHRPASESVAAA
jgi:flagellar biosynthesis repressor protein FlbT